MKDARRRWNGLRRALRMHYVTAEAALSSQNKADKRRFAAESRSWLGSVIYWAKRIETKEEAAA